MSTALALYEVEEALVALLDSEDMPMSDADRFAIVAEIAEATAAAREKRDACAMFIRSAEDTIEARRAEADRLKASAAAMEGNLERFKAYVLSLVELHGSPVPGSGTKRLTGRTFALRAVGNGGVRPLLTPDEARVPVDYKLIELKLPLRIWNALVAAASKTHEGVALAAESLAKSGKIVVHNESLRQELETGAQIAGAELGERGKHLRIS